MPQEHTYPIVGGHYRPPAKAICAVLPLNTKLFLRAEPDNAFDPNAIMVYLKTEDFPERSITAFNNEGAGYGWDYDRLKGEEQHHLGYIPKGLAAALRSDDSIAIGEEYEGEFTCNATGAPMIRFIL